MANNKIELSGLLNTPIIRKKERARITGKEIKIPSNYEKVMNDGIIKQEEIQSPDFSGIEKAQKELIEKISVLEEENQSLKDKLERISGPKKEILEKISKLEKENENLKKDLSDLLEDSEKSEEVNNETTSDDSSGK